MSSKALDSHKDREKNLNPTAVAATLKASLSLSSSESLLGKRAAGNKRGAKITLIEFCTSDPV